jgi:HEAT repeat protein
VHKPQAWNVPETISTAGDQYFDTETWVRDEIVDALLVYGYCSRAVQFKAIEDCQWLVRQTHVEVAALTSSPSTPDWKPYRSQGVSMVLGVNEDAAFLNRSGLPQQPLSALKDVNTVARQRALAEIVDGKLAATVDDLVPLVADANLITRRLALQALGKTKDPRAVALLESALFDPENCIRGMAALALRDVHGPQSAQKLLEAVEHHGNHMLREAVVPTLMGIKPPPRELMLAALKNSNADVRVTAVRVLTVLATNDDVPALVAALDDSSPPVRYFAAMAMGNIRRSPAAVKALEDALHHPDVVVVNRAAVSLGAMAARNEPALTSSRTQIVALLMAVFMRFDQTYQQVDQDWGYRAVGNALLDFGDGGKTALRELMSPGGDPAVADLAWRVLELPQRASQFTFTTEEQIEAALKDRPARTPAP